MLIFLWWNGDWKTSVSAGVSIRCSRNNLATKLAVLCSPKQARNRRFGCVKCLLCLWSEFINGLMNNLAFFSDLATPAFSLLVEHSWYFVWSYFQNLSNKGLDGMSTVPSSCCTNPNFSSSSIFFRSWILIKYRTRWWCKMWPEEPMDLSVDLLNSKCFINYKLLKST